MHRGALAALELGKVRAAGIRVPSSRGRPRRVLALAPAAAAAAAAAATPAVAATAPAAPAAPAPPAAAPPVIRVGLQGVGVDDAEVELALRCRIVHAPLGRRRRLLPLRLLRLLARALGCRLLLLLLPGSGLGVAVRLVIARLCMRVEARGRAAGSRMIGAG